MRTYVFADFELDLDANQLRHQGEPVQLERRCWHLLVLLVEQHGRLVSRDELTKALWPGNVIIDFDSGLNTLVRKVRRALGDPSDNPRFIATEAGRGYRFIAPVDTGQDPATPTGEQATRPRTNALKIMLVVLLLAGIGAFVWQANLPESGPTRVAVLPFENLTGNEQYAYLAAGLAEETSMSLAQVDFDDLAVIGGMSARALAASTAPLKKIGRELGVDFVVQSSLRLDGSLVRVTSRLIRVSDGEQVWSASFNRELINVLDLQRDISVAIAEQVRQRLSPDVAAAIGRRQTQNPNAYALYLKGRYAWGRFLPTSVSQAVDFYEQAVVEDPGYALAWAGIAHALITSPVTAGAEPRAVLAPASDALQHALENGPDLSEVQLALGAFHFFFDWDFPAAEAATRHAVALDPNSALAHMFLGIVLSQQGQHIEAREMLRRARELDPLFPLMFANSAVVSLNAGDAESAIEYTRQAIAMNAEFWVGYFHQGYAHLVLGDLAAALEAYSQAARLSGNGATTAVASRAFILARLGRRDDAQEMLEYLEDLATERYVAPYSFAIVYAGLGDVELAFDFLEDSLAARDVALLNIADDIRLSDLRAYPQFEVLMRLGGLDALASQ